ncbi:MAG: hypothetical protein ACLFR7_00520 [Opitutales bacterium]
MKQPSHIRPGFSAITPWLIVEGAHEMELFLQRAFLAEVVERLERSDGTTAHLTLQIGGAFLELAEAEEERPPRPATLHLYLPEVEVAYEAALDAGAERLFEPKVDERGEYIAGIVDAAGNHWYLAEYRGEVSEAEWKRREAGETEGAAEEETPPDAPSTDDVAMDDRKDSGA